jgi:hypothetical protein
MILLLLTICSCKTTKNEILENTQQELLLFYSKGACLGKCPVYDLVVYDNGAVIYNGIAKVEQKGELKNKLSSEQFSELKTILTENLGQPTEFKKIRDVPVTTLRFNDKKYEYHASRSGSALKKVEEKIQGLLSTVLHSEP